MIRALFKQTAIELVQGDITHEHVDAIVNAANPSLLGGGGVDRAIHQAAGPGLLVECQGLGGCDTGEAKITGAYRLNAKYVIHSVGPVYEKGSAQVPHLLASAYRRSLELATTYHVRTIAFPSISTGAYGYPIQQAAAIALATGIDFTSKFPEAFDTIRWVLFDSRTYATYTATLAAIATQNDSLLLL
ncbi:MAG: O-acetyl-ADP-ribose deacetylase [Anaerolineae bacterium]